jgi:hypothetical protein
MSIYTKRVSQITLADLKDLLEHGDVENLRLEFKREVPDRDETLKKLSSFANTYGGTMVVGATDVDGRIDSLPGVVEQSGYKQKVIDWCFLHATPPVRVEVSDPIPVENGKVCYMIRVPESDLAPHFLNGRKGIWVRVDEFSGKARAALADESEIRHLLDRRKAIIEHRESLLLRARRRLSAYLGAAGMTRPRLEMCFVPRFPGRPLCEDQQLSGRVEGSVMPYRQRYFPDLPSGVLSQHESVTIRHAAKGEGVFEGSVFFEANVWGMLFYAMRILEALPNGTGIDQDRVAGAVSLFIRHAATMLQSMGYTGPLVVETSLVSIRGVQWFYRPDGRTVHPHTGASLDDEVRFEIATSAEALTESRDRVAMEVLRPMMFAIDLPDHVNTNEKLEQLLRKGFNFNFWPTTEALKV